MTSTSPSTRLLPKVRIDIDLDIEKYSVNSEREIIFTPVIVADNLSDSLALDPIVIAGRNRWFHYLRDGELEDPLTPIYRARQEERPRRLHPRCTLRLMDGTVDSRDARRIGQLLRRA